MSQEAPAEDLQRWKHKYYDSLAENERQLQALAALESLLYRSLGRLALTGYGGNADLDKALDRLREALRARCRHDDIDALVESAGAVARRQIADRRPALSAAASPDDPRVPLTAIIEQLGNYPGARALRTRMEDAADTEQAARLMGDWLSEQFLEHEHHGKVTPRDEDSAGAAGALRHLSAALNVPPACRRTLEQLLHGQHDPLPRRSALELADRMSALLNGQLARAGSGSGALLQGALLELLRGLVSLFDDNPELRSLQASLNTDTDFEQHVCALGRIAHVVVSLHERVQAERAGIENFLGVVTERLQELESYVEGAHADHQAGESAALALGDDVTREVRDLEDAAGACTDQASLRETLNTRLTRINARVAAHVDQEQQRRQHALAELARLDRQLRETETEAGRLQRHLDEERARAAQDSLTGVWNRGAFDKRLDEEVARARRSRRPLALMFLDVDHFKRLNDSYGHQAGDRVLSSVAKMIASGLRVHDFPARYGGEEFVVLMPDTVSEQALVVAERVREAVAGASFRFKGQPVQVTLSAGVCELRDGDNPEEMVASADRALYEAKHAGRNRCVSAAA